MQSYLQIQSMIIRLPLVLSIFASCTAAWGAGLQASGDDSADIDLLINARLQLRAGDIRQAEGSTRDFLQKHPTSAQGHFFLGFILFREAQAKAAVTATQEKARLSLAEYTEGAKYRQPSSLDLKIVALDYVLFDDFAHADKWLTHSLTLNSKDAEAWYYLGRIKYSENKFPEAVQSFEQCLKADPQYVRAEEEKKKALAAESTAH